MLLARLPSSPLVQSPRRGSVEKGDSIACIPALSRDWRVVDLIALPNFCKVNPHAKSPCRAWWAMPPIMLG